MVIWAIFARVSAEELPMCGASTTFCILVSLWFFPIGSFSNTSRAAPAMIFAFNALTKSFSLIILPRAVLIRMADLFIFFMVFKFMIRLAWFFFLQYSVFYFFYRYDRFADIV